LIIGLIAGLNLILHLIAIKGFGYFRDELYYLACSDHLAFGYVDQPPLSILILKLIRLVFGDSLWAIRILPALGGAAFVFLTGVMARELGGKKFAAFLASVAAFAPIGNLFQFHVYSMNFIDILFWQACMLILIRLIKSENPKLWLAFGMVAGVGLQNKISILFLIFGLGVGILLTEHRRSLKSRHIWLGAGLAILIFLPYLIWNWTQGWPTLEFMHKAQAFKNIQNTPLGFLRDQIFYNNPLSLLIWLPGLWYFLFHKDGRKFRLLGWMFVSLYALMEIQNGKDYYLAAAYPVLFAGGAVLLENGLQSKGTRWLRPALATVILGSTIFLSPMALPVLPLEKTIAYYERAGQKRSQEKSELGVLPQHFADMFGWEEMAETFAKVYQTLSPEEQAKCLIYVRNYGEAAAIDFFGKKYGLPKASCPHNSYWSWGPPEWSGDVAIIMGTSRDPQKSIEDLKPYFQEVTSVAATSCAYCMPYENKRPIFICRGARFSMREIWPREKNFI
jgi:hypothetical protein